VYIVGDGAWASVLKFAGSGDCIRIYDDTAWGSRSTWGGGIVGITIDGSAATGTATGVHLGDLLQYELDVTVQNFTAAGSIGIHFDNNYYWTEQFYGRVYAQNCAGHVVFDVTSSTSSTATGSFERCEFDIYVDQEDAGFDGVAFRNGAFTGNSTLKIRGNFGYSTTTVDSAVLRLSAGSTIAESLLDIGVECASGAHTPQTIVFGSTAYAIIDCYGSLNFGLAGNTFTKSNNSGNVVNFLGHVTGDTALPQDHWVVCAPTTTSTNSAFLSGVTGHVAFRVLPTGSEVMITWALDIASGTKLTTGETIFTLVAAETARFAYSDNKIIPGNGSGGGQSGNVYAPAFLTATGAFQYTGPAYTSSGTSWWYGQGVYTLYTG
jgi:VCBS repeat-containing protein